MMSLRVNITAKPILKRADRKTVGATGRKPA